ncbi:MAG: helix-hairpin-helix domain-containing protein, partial [Bacteroidaceae bacterium]|nr:helix-hairpin-helix domain-containing protein [Bacteroidaceae bacterium]
MRLLLFLACLLLVSSVSAQHAWEDFVEEYTSGAIETEEGNLQQHLLDLKELYEHPMNINEAGVDDLMQLPFLSEAQIEQIHAYIYLHGQMQTLAELRLVPLLDEVTRRRLSFFVYAEPQKPEEKVRL